MNIEEKEITVNQTNCLALLPLKNVVILPKSIIPIIVGREQSIKAVEYAVKNGKSIFITAQKVSTVEQPTENDLFQIGTRATIIQVMRMPNNALKILAEGICRARATKMTTGDSGFILVDYEDMPTPNIEKTIEIEAIFRQIQTFYASYAKLNEKVPADLLSVVKDVEDMDCLTDTIAVHLANLSLNERQEILELDNLETRMLKVASLLKKEIEIIKTEQRIKGYIQNQVEKNQKEYYLTEQIKAIQKELGREDQFAESAQLKEKIKTLNLPKDVQEKADKELLRLEQMPQLSSEAVISRHYLDWIISLPWNKKSEDSISLTQAEKILEKSHAKLTKAKERIIEFLAAKKYSANSEKATIICLVGPPGVGKTSLAQAISKSLEREFVRISLGGIRDEAEIRGHRRTYVGALPGKIIQAMRKVKITNPVILLDEIDKMSRDVHGDPAAALLEVLDPEQNKGFVDHFLDTEYDLSNVMFIATANHMEGIPYALLDRMEIISLSGYTEIEKIEIARQFLIPKKLKEYNLKASQIKISDEIFSTLICEYTKESGVRQLERLIAKFMRKTIQLILKDKNTKNLVVTQAHVKEWLGQAKFKKTSLDANKLNNIGLATGLAWTEVGGDMLEIETTVVPGKGSVTLTGQLGEIMQESAQAALTYIRSRAKELGLKNSFAANKDIHIHIPEGATPKDGPSAGITMCGALISSLTKVPLKPNLAMTGEITLRGRVLAVGGLKEKLLAAKQYKISTVLVPKENYDDIQEFIKDLGDELEIIYVETMDEVIKHTFMNHKFSSVKSDENVKPKNKVILKPSKKISKTAKSK